MDCSTPGFSVHYQLPELAQTHVPQVGDAINHLIFCRSFCSCLQCFPELGSFPMSQLFTSGGQSIGASASASVLPMVIQDWFSLGLTALISFQSKGLSRVFSSMIESINSLVLSFLYGPALTSVNDYWENHSHVWLYGPLLTRKRTRPFLEGLVIKALSFQCRGHMFDSWLGN